MNKVLTLAGKIWCIPDIKTVKCNSHVMLLILRRT